MAIKRMVEILHYGLTVREEALRLQELELQDKMLNRGFYYEPNEPAAYVSWTELKYMHY